MENAAEALKMAFAVMIFTLALTVSIMSFNRAKATSDIVLYSQDETNFYEYQGVKGAAAQNREVGLETIIPTLYNYFKENYTVVFRQGSYDTTTGKFSNLRHLPIYDTPSIYKTSAGVKLWGVTNKQTNINPYDELMENKYSSILGDNWQYSENENKHIFSFDLDEETLRREPWTGSYDKAKENLDKFLQGAIYNNPNNNQKYIDYGKDSNLGNEGFIGKYFNRKFIETIAEYKYNSSQTEDSVVSTMVKQKSKRMIIFTLIN